MSKYGGISEETISKKYEITPILEDTDEILDDYYRMTLMNTGPDPTTLASDMKRTNNQSSSKLNLLHSGNRSNSEPVHYDLFLGFTEKDPRGTQSDPDMRRYVDQQWHRTKNYKNIFSSDVDNSIPSEGVGNSKLISNMRKAQFKSKDYLKIFDTSKGGWHTGYSGMPDYKPIGKKIEKSNMIADLNDIDNIEQRRDDTIKKSMAIPKGYNSVPDHKYKIAKYGKKGKTKSIYGTDIVKNKNAVIPDSGKIVEFKENLIPKALVILMDNIIRERKRNQDPSLNEKMEDSKNTQYRKTNNNKLIDKTEEAKNIKRTHKKNKLMEEINKSFTTPVNNKDIRKNMNESKNDIIHSEINKSKNANKTQANMEGFITTQLMNKILQDHKTKQNGNNKKTMLFSHISPELHKHMNKTKYNTHIQKEGIQKIDPDNYKFYKYKSNMPKDNINFVDKDKEGFDTNALLKKSTGKRTQLRSRPSQKAENNNKEHVKNDQLYNISGTKNRRTGKLGSKYMVRNIEIDQEQNVVMDR